MFKYSVVLIISHGLLPSYLLAFQMPTGQSNSYFDVQIDRVEQLYADNNYAEWSGIKVKKINKTRSIVGEVIFYQSIGDGVMAEAAAYVKQGGEYRLMPYKKPKMPMCQFYMDDPYIYPKVAEKSDFPMDLKADCPFKAGTYKVHGFFLDLDKLPKIIAPSGDYAGELTWSKDEKIIFKCRIYATIVNV